MSEFPAPVRDFMLALTEDRRSPAYMLVTDEGGLSEWGGDLASYDITGLEKGVDVGDHVPFLQGMLPLETHNVFLPYIQTEAGQYADVYLFSRDEGTWILLLDATGDATKRQTLQQKAGNLNLQVAELEREGEALYKRRTFLSKRSGTYPDWPR